MSKSPQVAHYLRDEIIRLARALLARITEVRDGAASLFLGDGTEYSVRI